MSAKQIFANNLRTAMLWAGIKVPELAKKSGVSTRHLRYILAGERGPSVDMAEDIAGAFGLEGYHLQMKSFDPELIKEGAFDRIYAAYAKSDEEGRRVMETTASYLSKQKAAEQQDPANPDSNGDDKKGTMVLNGGLRD